MRSDSACCSAPYPSRSSNSLARVFCHYRIYFVKSDVMTASTARTRTAHACQAIFAFKFAQLVAFPLLLLAPPLVRLVHQLQEGPRPRGLEVHHLVRVLPPDLRLTSRAGTAACGPPAPSRRCPCMCRKSGCRPRRSLYYHSFTSDCRFEMPYNSYSHTISMGLFFR